VHARLAVVGRPIFWGDAVVGSVLVLKPMKLMAEPPKDYIAATKAAAALSRAGGAWPT
jgi:hypothetical protein